MSNTKLFCCNGVKNELSWKHNFFRKKMEGSRSNNSSFNDSNSIDFGLNSIVFDLTPNEDLMKKMRDSFAEEELAEKITKCKKAKILDIQPKEFLDILNVIKNTNNNTHGSFRDCWYQIVSNGTFPNLEVLTIKNDQKNEETSSPQIDGYLALPNLKTLKINEKTVNIADVHNAQLDAIRGKMQKLKERHNGHYQHKVPPQCGQNIASFLDINSLQEMSQVNKNLGYPALECLQKKVYGKAVGDVVQEKFNEQYSTKKTTNEINQVDWAVR